MKILYFLGDKQSQPSLEKDGISTFEAGLQLASSMVGTGVLFMPQAFALGGIAPGLIVTAFISLCSVFNFGLVIKSAQFYSARDNVPSYGYSEAMELSLEAHETLKPYRKIGKKIISGFIILSCLSATMVYQLMASKNLIALLKAFDAIDLNTREALGIVVPLYLILQLISKMKHLTFVTLIGVLSIWTGLISTTYRIIEKVVDSGGEEVEVFNSNIDLMAVFANILFAFSGITTITPIENNMKHKRSFIGFISVVSVVMTIVFSAYCIFAILGYIAYGVATAGPVTANMSEADALSKVLQGAIFVGLTFQVPINLFASFEILGDYVMEKLPGWNKFFVFYGFRIVMSLIVVAVPLAFPSIEALLNLCGAFFTVLQYVFPVILDWLTFQKQRQGWKGILYHIRNTVMLTFGCIFVVICLYQSVIEVINADF